MSRKASKLAAASNKKGSEEEREDSLQAVVLADSFEKKFSPFARERPRCLLPLVNTPLIEYTLEFLAKAGVQDIFVYCGAHTEQVEEYLRTSKWQYQSSPFKKLEIIKTNSRSVGDLMRDLDSRHIITGDFLVLSGDVVSNIPLEPALAKHRARRATDKNAIMTIVLRKAGSIHRTKAQGPSPVFVLDPTKDRCLHYEEMHSLQDSKYINIDPDLLSSHSEIDLRNDLIDCNIDICTPDVLALWTDSFDYESPRKHFLYGVLKDHELNGKTIHAFIVEEHYAARVRDLQAYDAISKDIVSRWAYPICPDSNLLPSQSYRFQRGHIYMEDGVMLARSCLINRRTVIGQNTSIGDGSIISNSIVGRRCQIGRNVKIDGAYIWDDVVISDDSEVRRAIIANEAVVGPQCTIEAGALISYRVQLGKGTTVQSTSRMTARSLAGQDDQGSAEASGSSDRRSSGGSHKYIDSEDDDDDEEVEGAPASSLIYSLADFAVSDSSISTLDSRHDLDEPLHHVRSAAGSFTMSTSDEGHDGEFHLDASSSIFDALQREEGPDIVQLELQGLRMGVDADYHQVRRAVITAFAKRIQQLMEQQSLGVDEAVSEVVKKYQVVFEKVVFDKEKEIKSDQIDFLLLLQKDLVHRHKGDSVLVYMVRYLYELDVLEEDGINQWWQDVRSAADDELVQVRAQTQAFIDWLANAEEDSEEDEEEEEEEEGES